MLREPGEDRECLFIATTGLSIPWFQPLRMVGFTAYTLGILAQLHRASGCLGYSLRAELRQGSTISIWQDAESLKQFQVNEPHAGAMVAFRSTIARPFRYAQWKGSILTLPSSWEEIDARFAKPTRPA
jgi:hypothetical protein